MDNMDWHNMPERVTDWHECKNGPWYPGLKNGGYVAYRIHTKGNSLRMFQRHEWKCADGTLEMEKWIQG